MPDDQQAHWDALNKRIDEFERRIDERRAVIDRARQRLALRYFHIAIGVAIVHFLSGIDILISGGTAVLSTVPLSFLSTVLLYVHHDYLISHPHFVAAVLIAVAILAVVPFLRAATGRWLFMILVAPQQLLLLCKLISIELAIFSGRYADGYVPDGGAYFIFADQVWLLMVIFYHTLEYVETYKIRVISELIPLSPSQVRSP